MKVIIEHQNVNGCIGVPQTTSPTRKTTDSAKNLVQKSESRRKTLDIVEEQAVDKLQTTLCLHKT